MLELRVDLFGTVGMPSISMTSACFRCISLLAFEPAVALCADGSRRF